MNFAIIGAVVAVALIIFFLKRKKSQKIEENYPQTAEEIFAKEEKINSRPEFIPMLLDKKNDPKHAAAREKYAAEIRQARLDSGLPALGINALPGAASSGKVPPPPGYNRD